MAYELKQSDIFGLAHSLGAEYKEKGDELVFKHCPYCNGGGKDKNTFSINLITGAYKCFRASCNAKGHFVELCRDKNYHLDFNQSEPKKYRKLPQRTITVRDNAIKFL